MDIYKYLKKYIKIKQPNEIKRNRKANLSMYVCCLFA